MISLRPHSPVPSRFFPRLGLALACLFIGLFAGSARAAERSGLKVLTIGNSFADYATTFLPALAEAGGKSLVLGKANLGGCSLERHATLLGLAEANDPGGRVYTGFIDPVTGKRRTVTLPEALSATDWDVVTLQQVSSLSYRSESYHPHVDRIIAAIRRLAPGAEIVIHETWAYREDHPSFGRGDGFTPLAMYQGLSAAYRRLSAETGFRLIPCGDAFDLARRTPRWTYRPDPDFDFEHPPEGRLPDQGTSLNAGWSWTKDKTGKLKFTLDAIHLNEAGRYLAACTWYLTLFQTDRLPAGFVPAGLTEADAASLRAHALGAVDALWAVQKTAAPAASR